MITNRKPRAPIQTEQLILCIEKETIFKSQQHHQKALKRLFNNAANKWIEKRFQSKAYLCVSVTKWQNESIPMSLVKLDQWCFDQGFALLFVFGVPDFALNLFVCS